MSFEDQNPSPDTPTMEPFELILLSSFSFPTHNALYLSEEDVTCFLNGYIALWHPAALSLGQSLPRIGSPYDFELPQSNYLYGVPTSPPSSLPEHWEENAKAEGAIVFHVTENRKETINNLLNAIREHAETHNVMSDNLQALLSVEEEKLKPFFALGFGQGHLEALFEAMDHENLMDFDGIQSEVERAIAQLLPGEQNESESEESPFQIAAQKLLEARDVLYTAPIYILDFYLLDEDNANEPLPAAFDQELSLNLITTGAVFKKYAEEQPEQVERLRKAVTNMTAEVCAGSYAEHEEPLLPIESQLWNLTQGTKIVSEILGQDIRSHARKRFYAHPQTPSFLHSVGIEKTLLVSFDEHVLPHYHSTVVNWPSVDDKQVDSVCRMPYPGDNPQTYYHLSHYLNETIMQDHAATLAIIHPGKPCPWYDDWRELSRLAPVLGQWLTLTQYVEEVSAGDYSSPSMADEFQADFLSERTKNPEEPEPEPSDQEVHLKVFEPDDECRSYPVSSFAQHAKLRRCLDTAWTLAAFYRTLAGKNDQSGLSDQLAEVELELEQSAPVSPANEAIAQRVNASMNQSAQTLADRLLAKGEEGKPGYLVMNPCSFARRTILELDNVEAPIPLGGPVKFSQFDEGRASLVVELPALGFAWFPAMGEPPANSKMVMADERCVRNDIFEAEIHHETGGLKGIRDHRTRINRMGQQLVFHPGSRPKVESIETTSTGPAYGEIITTGTLINEQEEVLAKFRQRFRAWMGRPVLDMQIELEPQQPLEGYPWHNYFGSRFAWADERAPILRGVGSLGYFTSQMRPESPDYLDFMTRQRTVILPQGLPFHQRQGGRMLDVILVPPGEKSTTFDIGIGLDREYPLLTAYGMITPTPVVKTTKGLPAERSTGWLYHLDVPNVLLTSLRPAPDNADGVSARLIEAQGFAGNARLRCLKDPARAELTDARGITQMAATYDGDTIMVDANEGELIHLRIDFSE